MIYLGFSKIRLAAVTERTEVGQGEAWMDFSYILKARLKEVAVRQAMGCESLKRVRDELKDFG